MTPQELESAKDGLIEILRRKRELLLKEREIEDDEELMAAYPWPNQEELKYG
jgi:hypothetical protein